MSPRVRSAAARAGWPFFTRLTALVAMLVLPLCLTRPTRGQGGGEGGPYYCGCLMKNGERIGFRDAQSAIAKG